MKKRFPRFQILFIGGIFFLLGTNFLAILFPNDNQNHKNYWYSSIGFEIIPSTYADDDDDREDHEDRKRGRENKEDHDDDREDDKENDDDDNYYYTPPVTQPPVDNNTPVTPPASNCQTIYDTVTNASGVSSQVPRQVCDTTLPVVPPTPVTPPVALVPEKVIQKPVTPPVVVVPAPVTPPTSNCQTVYDTVYDTVTTASGTQIQEPRQVSKQVCDTTTVPATTVVIPEKVVPPPAPVIPKKPVTPLTQKNPPAPITGIYKNGTYKGDGYYLYTGGSVTYTVSLTLESSRITEAHFLAFTPSGNSKYTRADGDATLATLVRLQNTSIDTVTGATGTSQAIQDAINIALGKAKGENVTTNPPVLPPAPEASTTPKPIVSPYVQSTLVQSSDDVAPVYVSESQIQSVSPDIQDTIETFVVPSDEIAISSPSLSSENEVIPTSHLVERIATKDGKAYSIIKNLENGRYILLDEKDGKRDPHTFQFKEDIIAYATTSQQEPETFIERVFQFFASLFSESSEAPVVAESPIITKTQLLAQADLQTRTMKQKALKQKVAEAIAQFEMQNAQKPDIAQSVTVQKKTVSVTQKTGQVTPKKSVASVTTSTPTQKSVSKKSVVNTVTQAS